VGTIEYMAPELLAGEEYSFEVDFWAMGVMLHEVLTGYTIGAQQQPSIALDLLEPPAADLVSQMLIPDRARRLGAREGPGRAVHAIRTHPYFAAIDWDALLRKEVPGPLSIGKLTLDGRRAIVDRVVDGPRQRGKSQPLKDEDGAAAVTPPSRSALPQLAPTHEHDE
jgi:serine/threonine protein kinase